MEAKNFSPLFLCAMMQVVEEVDGLNWWLGSYKPNSVDEKRLRQDTDKECSQIETPSTVKQILRKRRIRPPHMNPAEHPANNTGSFLD